MIYNLKTHFDHMINLNDKDIINLKSQNSELFAYKLETLDKIQPLLLNFLNLPIDTKIPRARDKNKRNNYLFKEDINKIAQELENKKEVNNFLNI